MPKMAPSLGIQRPKLQSQSIGELRDCIVMPLLAMMEASLIEERCLRSFRNSTEAAEPELSMKLTPATERDSLEDV